MRTTPDCFPCLLGQALRCARLVSADPGLAERAVREVAALLPGLDCSLSPPENALFVYAVLERLSGCPDPFAEKKRQGNAMAMELLPWARERLQEAASPLDTALRLAVAANVMDYGATAGFDARKALERSLRSPLAVDHAARLQDLLASLPRAAEVLYLADNAGEIVFDTLVVELLLDLGLEVRVVVRARPILNDATMEDARISGMTRLCQVMDQGCGVPGCPPRACSPALRRAMDRAALIISKGQGNFETLSEFQGGPIVYLLTVKCPPVARLVTAMAGLEPGLALGLGEGVIILRNTGDPRGEPS